MVCRDSLMADISSVIRAKQTPLHDVWGVSGSVIDSCSSERTTPDTDQQLNGAGMNDNDPFNHVGLSHLPGWSIDVE